MPAPVRSATGRYPAQEGFTLLEVIISAAILGLTVAGVTTLIASGRALDSSSRLRSQAFTLASNTLERTGYHYLAYPVPAAVNVSYPVLVTESGANCTATKTDSVYAPASDFWVDANGGSPVEVPYQRFTVMLTWTCGGLADTLILRKRIADVES